MARGNFSLDAGGLVSLLLALTIVISMQTVGVGLVAAMLVSLDRAWTAAAGRSPAAGQSLRPMVRRKLRRSSTSS